MDRHIQRALQRVDPSRWPELREQADLDQIVRALHGAYWFPLAMLAIALTTTSYRDMPGVMWTLTAVMAAGALLRSVVGLQRQTLRHAARRVLFAISVPMLSLPMGVVFPAVIYRYGLTHWMFPALLIWFAGMGAAALVTFAPDLGLAHLQLLPIFVPAVLLSLWSRDPQTLALGLGLGLFLCFLLARLRVFHAAYWRQLAGQALEADQLRELESARQCAREAGESKARFLANVSHEIRTPMHSVLGMTELVLDTAVTSEQREYLFALRRSASSLLEIVNDLLDLSKIEAAKIRLEPEVFDIRSAIEDVRMTLTRQTDAKRLRLETSVDAEIPLAIEGDPLRLRQVLVNLGGNAIKFTDSGFARIGVRLQQAYAGTVRLCFSVEDSGMGIRDETLGNIFETFSQADGSAPRQFGGTGLGLSIASQLVRLMGGEISVQNRPDVGSVFSFCCTFPVGVIAEPVVTKEPAVKRFANPLHILVAEDNAVNQLVAVRLLKVQGHSVEVAATGAEAVHAVISREFDLVLMDNQMPELSGIEATIRIRELGFQLPIVALSANAMPEDRERFLMAGMNGCLAKPFHAEELYAEIQRVVGEPGLRSVPAPVRSYPVR